MRIAMIISTDFPPDIRLEKEIRTLQEAHQVSLLCRAQANKAPHETWHGAEIYRVLPGLAGARAGMALMATCRSGAWQKAIEQHVVQTQPDALHVHDLPLLGDALAVARRHSLPLVSDLHENYPAMLADGLKVPLLRLRSLGLIAQRLLLSIDRWQRYEDEVVIEADHVVVVIDEAKDRLTAMGIAPEKVSVVGNYASQSAPASSAQVHQPGSFRVVYAGAFGATRDLATVVDAVKLLDADKFADLEVHLIGGRGRDFEHLQQKITNLKVEDRVHVARWMPLEEVEALMAGANIGLVPHCKSAHTDATIPHKLFQYMHRELPVIVSDCAPLQRIVTETKCGLCYTSGNAQELAQCMAQIYADSDLASEMGRAGKEAVESRFNWDAAGAALLDVYATKVHPKA